MIGALRNNSFLPRIRYKGLQIGCGVLLAGIALTGIAAPWLAPHDPNHVELLHKFASPSLEYPFGTDHLGRCVLSRLLIGIRISLGISIAVMVFTLLIGMVVGTFSALKGGLVDATFMRLCDLLLAFPTLVLAFALLGIFGTGVKSLIMALVLSQWVYYARMVRGMVLSIHTRSFIQAAIVNGTRRWMLLWRHILPNISTQILVLAALEIGTVILEVTGFSFLGLGVQAPTPEWGMMMNEARQQLRQHPEMMWIPGLAVMFVVIVCNVLGESLRDYYDPKGR
ncbi:nickel transport system permease protein [Paenibacillus sp. V4I9]|uniref:ABC transporter permease n=1 Tax=Paenibacillus sp. V4I9 TaxID=3042308 RepID=UPI00277EF36A|nr:ABC transporter permease subunit [Paenibacillus sp. V4I9]MDQ0888230.1 nickel transport system permease protein [Paenibacillus sp. V4I9]